MNALVYNGPRDAAVFTIESGLDLAAMENSLGQGHQSGIVVDITAVGEPDNPLLAALVVLLRRLAERELHVVLVGADSRLTDIVALCGVNGIEFAPTVRDGLRRVEPGHRIGHLGVRIARRVGQQVQRLAG